MNGIFYQSITNSSKIGVSTQRTPDSQNNFEKEEQNHRNHTNFQTIVQRHISKLVWYWHKNRHPEM